MSETKWTYDREHGEVLDGHCRPVLYVSASRMDFNDVEGRLGAATKIGRLAAAAPDLAEAAELLEHAEEANANCPECNGDGEPEACPLCFPLFDDARVKRRAALARAKGAS